MKKLLVAIDQGTTSTRAILFDVKGNVKFISQFEFKQYFPKNGWVEHNPNEIWLTTLKALRKVIKKASDLKGNIISLGITNQRETTILWDKKTGKPVYNAIVWQDRRTQTYCEKLKKRKYEKSFRKKTGLFIDPYFSATKIKWILENVKDSKKLLKSNNLLFGTVDTFLIWKLTKGKKHLTEATNASRTMLFNINNNKWDKEILRKLNIPKNILPEVKNSADDFGITNKKIIGKEIPISAVLGDQQAAAVGQACFEKGSIKSTYGTGAFVIMNTGSKKIYSNNKLLTTICYRLNGKNTYALEGSIFIAGAGVQWLRDKVKLINNAYETEKIAKSKKIRVLLKKYQKNFAKKNHVCIEGRDIGSVICPNADIKLFFKCNFRVRAKRRWNEYKKNNSKITLAEVKKALIIRDYSDINRKHSPLRVSKDSIVIDTSKLSKKQMLSKISKIVESKLLLKYGRNIKAR